MARSAGHGDVGADRPHGPETRVLLRDVLEAGDVADDDAFAVGSVVYLGHWRKEAVEFVRVNGATLSHRPGASCGSVTPGCVFRTGEAWELHELRDAAGSQAAAGPREHPVFLGVIDAGTLGVAERLRRARPAGRNMLPEGHLSDWQGIESWAASIADELSLVPVGRP